MTCGVSISPNLFLKIKFVYPSTSHWLNPSSICFNRIWSKASLTSENIGMIRVPARVFGVVMWSSIFPLSCWRYIKLWLMSIIFCVKSQSSHRSPRTSPIRAPVPSMTVNSGIQCLYVFELDTKSRNLSCCGSVSAWRLGFSQLWLFLISAITPSVGFVLMNPSLTATLKTGWRIVWIVSILFGLNPISLMRWM